MFPRTRSAVLAALPVLALLPLCWAPTVALGGEGAVPPLFFFAPIGLAALHGGRLAVVATALLSGLLAGPLTPQDVEAGTAQGTSEWLVRTGFFVAFAIGAALAVERLRREAAEHRDAREVAERSALHDPLTGLPNRAMLAEHLSGAIARARRGGRTVVLAYIDLDDFKVVNDSLGHAAGDDLLRAVAERFDLCVRAGDVLARQGGDEFLLMLPDLDPADAEAAAGAAAERLRAALDDPFVLGGAELQIGASIGVSVFGADAADAETLHRHADAAMYQAKQGGSGWALFEESSAAPLARLSLAAQLRRAIEFDELEVHYQPILELDGGSIRGLEALVRWQRPDGTLVLPGDFIPAAEETGVIDALGEWVLDAVCRQARRWEELGLAPNFGVNVSPRQLRRPGFAGRFGDQIRSHGLPPSRFIVELTESAWTLDADRTLPVLDELKAAGLQLALDDFGAGYSSLSRLLALPVDVVKVDRSLLAGVPERADAVAVLTAIQRLAEACECDVVAEGVETDAQAAFLRGLGCRLGQGFGLARPAPADHVTLLLQRDLTVARRPAPPLPG